MKNQRIKEAMERHGLKQWEVAEILGISEFTMCRKMRHDLPDWEQDRIVSIIEGKNETSTNMIDTSKETSTNIPEMITIREVADRTGMSYEAIRHLCVTGKIPHIRVGNRSGKYLVNFARFIDYLNGDLKGVETR